jgi:hypothetical protein
MEDANRWLKLPRHVKTADAIAWLQQMHGKKVSRCSGPFVDAAFNGELLVTKDRSFVRLWRARDGNLLLLVPACPGAGVAFSPTGGNIVTGTANTSKIKVWGPRA